MRMIKHLNLMISTCEPRLWVTTEHGEILGETDRNSVWKLLLLTCDDVSGALLRRESAETKLW